MTYSIQSVSSGITKGTVPFKAFCLESKKFICSGRFELVGGRWVLSDRTQHMEKNPDFVNAVDNTKSLDSWCNRALDVACGCVDGRSAMLLVHGTKKAR